MRVALSNASSKWGGLHVATELLARGFTARGHEVVVFGYPDSPLEERMRDIAPFEAIGKGMDASPLAFSRAASALRRHRTQVVLALSKKDVRRTIPAAWMLRIPSAIRYANDRELRARLYDRLFFGTMPSLHIANSNATRETLLMSAPWIPRERVTVIYNGVDPRPLEEAAPTDLNLPADAIKLGFVGRLEARKGIIDLANAWRFIAEWLPKSHLVITGTGAEEAEARRILGESSRVHWLGYRRDVPSILKSLDVLIMPSHWEGFGFVAAEALLAGTPVVASRASSLPELMINGVHARLVPPGEPRMLAKEIVAFVNNPAGMKRMAAAGRVRILTEFSPGVMVDRYEKALSQLVQR